MDSSLSIEVNPKTLINEGEEVHFVSENGVSATVSPLSRFLYSHFSQEERALVRELSSTLMSLTQRVGSPEAALAIIADITRTTGWATGPPNPTNEQIDEYVQQTAGVLGRHDLFDLDPAKHFASILLAGKLLSQAQKKGGEL